MRKLKEIQDLSTHARSRLAPSKKRGLTKQERLALYKSFLKIEEHRIHLLHKSGGSGLRIAGRRSDLIDVIVKNLWEDALEEIAGDTKKSEDPLTIIATGGYGRGRLNPQSDIDIHFILPNSMRAPTPAAVKMVESILYMLYDCGFKVGHAVRSLKESISQANEDPQTKSSLIESRLICGDEDLFAELQERFLKQCVRGKEKAYLALRLEDLRNRHAKYDSTVYLQEPQVKEGCGGLRDYQNLIWIAFVKRGTTRIKDLVKQKLLTERSYREIRKAYSFLMRVRNELHYEQGRSTDILTLRLQGIVAENFGYPGRGILRKTEAFMRDYYMHTRNLFQRSMELVDRFYLEQKVKVSKGSAMIGFLARRKKREERFDGFVSRNNRLYADNKGIFKENHHRLMRLFQHAQLRHLRMSPELFQLVTSSYAVINRTFRFSRTNRETFEAIMSRRGEVGTALRQMHRTGVLGKYIPEFGALTNLVQHEFFHRYTADEHTLRVVEQLDGLITSENPKHEMYRDLFHKIEDPYILYLAILLHDTGRAANTDHHDESSTILANDVAARMRMTSHRRRRLLFLVANHLDLWRHATTRNIDDPRTVEEFATIVRDQKNLDDLLLLTFADSRGTNEEGWTDWKESLIRQLYYATSEYLRDREAFEKKSLQSTDDLMQELGGKLGESYTEEIFAHLANMPERYFRFREAHMIATHIRLCREFTRRLRRAKDGELPDPVIKWKELPDQGCSRLTVVCTDRPKLLASIAGAISALNINIIGADAFARADGLVLDIFRVCTTNFEPVASDRTKSRFEKSLLGFLEGDETDFEALIRKNQRSSDAFAELGRSFPQRVYINNDSNRDYTLIEIQALDRLGLLHGIFTAIAEQGLAISNSRISTSNGAAIDTIFVVDAEGNKITDRGRVQKLHSAIEEAIRIK